MDVTVELRTCPSKRLLSALEHSEFALRVANADDLLERTRVVPVGDTRSAMRADMVLAGPDIEHLSLECARRQEIEAGAGKRETWISTLQALRNTRFVDQPGR